MHAVSTDALAHNAMANSASAPPDALGRVLVIGGGPVGMRFVDELLKRRPLAQVEVFSNEPHRPYNRVQLSNLLAGQTSPESLDLPLPDPAQHPYFRLHSATIIAIDPLTKRLEDSHGEKYRFDHLVIATGARAHVPNIPGIKLPGVFTFRRMHDAQLLASRTTRSRHLVVVGGGVLGIEAAKAMARLHTKVTLIQQAPHLMNRQLDDTAAQLLEQQLRNQGVDILLHAGVREVLGEARVTGVRTLDGAQITCDSVLLCTGIKPNIELAYQARLRVGNGINVDDRLQTSNPDIYAIGECCEHRGQTYGLVAPGLEQAAVLADSLAGGSARYQGSTTVSRLKVVNEQVVSLGEVVDLPFRPRQSQLRFLRRKQQHYRTLVLLRGRIIGAAGLGEWPEFARIQEAFQTQRRLWPWQWLLFWLCGRLWLRSGADDVRQWPASAVVCQCNQVALHTLRQAQRQGCNDVASLSQSTRAGTVCGSCRPLMAQLVGQSASEKTYAWPVLLGTSVLGLLVAALLVWLPAASLADSVQQQGWFEKIWNDKDYKQVSGFSLLGLVAVGLLMSLRKRLSWAWLGGFKHWRIAHALLGAGGAALLMLHTGFHLGENLNRWLMLCFLAVLVLGSAAGLASALSHRLSPALARRLQQQGNWLHVLVAWPLPVLLAVHILTVYYF